MPLMNYKKKLKLIAVITLITLLYHIGTRYCAFALSWCNIYKVNFFLSLINQCPH